jgi:predicted permease
MDAELRLHFERMVEDLVEHGVVPDEARRRARLEFGGLGQVKDDAREARRAGYVEGFWRGLRMAWRALAKSPGFTAVAVVTLALGIGVNTIMFSLLDHLLLRNLPVRDPRQLVVLHGNFTTPPYMYRNTDRGLSFSWPEYADFRDKSTVFSGVAARFATDGSLEYHGAAEKVSVELVSGDYFDVLGVRPAVGRVLGPDDDRTEMGHPLVVLGYSYWQRRFGGDPGIVGRQVRLDGMPMTVVGVSAAGFHSVDRGQDDDVRVPMTMKRLLTPGWPELTQWKQAWLNIVARMKPGISIQQAQAGANVLYHQILSDEAAKLPPHYARRQEFLSDRLDLLPASGGMMDRTSDQKAFVEELMAISGVVLLIACVNLAGLLLARTAGRHRELAIRLALGAGRMGVVRLLLAENLLLSILGGGAGVLLAMAIGRPAARLLISPDAGPLLDSALDWRVLGFGLLLAALTAIAFCLAPAVQMRKMQLADVLKTESGATAGRAHVRLRKAMVMAQLGFCTWLVMGAGLFAKSLSHLKAVDLGFRKEHLITFQLDPQASGYKPERTIATYRRLIEALGGLPGVTAVASSDYGVLTGGVNLNVLQIEGYRLPASGAPYVRELVVSPGYMQALGMPLRTGRDFTAADIQKPPR